MREVEATTLDALIEQFAVPAFVKNHVEGGEPSGWRGCSYADVAVVRVLPRALDYACRCMRLSALGPYAFNWSGGESSNWRQTGG